LVGAVEDRGWIAMETRPFQFRLRSLVLVVTSIALVLGGVAELERRRRVHRELAAWHLEQMISCQKELDARITPEDRYTLFFLDPNVERTHFYRGGTLERPLSPEERTERQREIRSIRIKYGDLQEKVEEHWRLARYYQDGWW
jgi:hypothetical protein